MAQLAVAPLMIDESNRWLPDSPHKEAVLAMVRCGRAHVEPRGHGLAPLLVFTDGGVMELPRARVKADGKGFWQDPTSGPGTRQTKHCDICGSLDELKALLQHEPELADQDPQRLLGLLDDVDYMLSRLVARREEYEAFVAELESAAAAARALAPPDVPAAQVESAELRRALGGGADAVRERLAELHERGERFRDVANASERVVAAHRDVAVQAGKAFLAVRGARDWDDKLGRATP